MNKAVQLKTGRLLATPGAIEALHRNKVNPLTYLSRHVAGDWGEIPQEDKTANDRAVEVGSRILSAYLLPDETKLWLISEATFDESGNREATTFLLPEEY